MKEDIWQSFMDNIKKHFDNVRKQTIEEFADRIKEEVCNSLYQRHLTDKIKKQMLGEKKNEKIKTT